MQLIIDVPEKEGIEKILELLEQVGVKNIKIRKENRKDFRKEREKTIDLSRYTIKSFEGIDGVNYQRTIRDEW